MGNYETQRVERSRNLAEKSPEEARLKNVPAVAEHPSSARRGFVKNGAQAQGVKWTDWPN